MFNGGQAFTTQKWTQINYLIELTRAFRELPAEDAAAVLSDPLTFRGFVRTIKTGQAAQRQALLYLAFPEFYLPVVSATHLKLIRDAFAEEYLGQEPTEDIDVDLHHIYSNIIAAEGKSVDLYTPPWAEKWQPSKSQPEPDPGTAHAWRIYGSNVAGTDMVPVWQQKSSVSLAAKFLRPVNSDISFDNLKSIVDKDYSTVNYTARKEKTEEFYSFLTQMNPGDLVVTVSQGKVYFGTVTGDATYADDSAGRSKLRRPVHWYEESITTAQLPPELSTRLNEKGEVLDLTGQIDTIRTLIDLPRPTPADSSLHLPDADEYLAGCAARETLEETGVTPRLGLPLEGVGLLLAIDPILDMARTATNVAGQALVPTIVAKRNGILDEDVYNGRVSTGSATEPALV